MVKNSGEKENRFVKKQIVYTHSEKKYYRQPQNVGDGDLHGMETDRGCGIHSNLGVMSGVKTPEKWNCVVESMPEIYPEIEQEEYSCRT